MREVKKDGESEWYKLIAEAKQLGLTLEEVQAFLNKSNPLYEADNPDKSKVKS